MSVNGEQIEHLDSQTALFDTGTTMMILCKSAYHKVLSILDNLGCSTWNQSEILCSCEPAEISQYPIISFYSRGLKMDVTPDIYLVNQRINPVKMMNKYK